MSSLSASVDAVHWNVTGLVTVEPSDGDTSVGAVGSLLLTLEILIPIVWSFVIPSPSVARMFTA